MSQDKVWWCANGQERSGPHSATELKKLAQIGAVNANSMIWKDGMDNWVSATLIKGLIESNAVVSPPPLPSAIRKPSIDSAEFRFNESKLNHDEEHLRVFVGKEYDNFFAPAWDKIKKGNKFSWNGWAWFFGPLWFAHRKMYLASIINFFTSFCINASTQIIGLKIQIQYAIAFVIMVVAGFVANKIYLNHSKKIINEILINNKGMNQKTQNAHLELKGGTSMITAIGFLFFYVLVGAALVVFINKAFA